MTPSIDKAPDFAAGIEAADYLHDLTTHRRSWRNAIECALNASAEGGDDGDVSYWRHELNAYDRAFAAYDAALTPPAAAPVEAGERLTCFDCPQLYEADDWVEAVIPCEAWDQISPHEEGGGVLCVSCMARRLVAAGLNHVPVEITAGPMRTSEHNNAALRAVFATLPRDTDRMREVFNYLAKWVERGLFCEHTTPEEALKCIAYHPGLPWMKGRWDVDHKPYAEAFYKAFPKARALNGGEG